MCGIVGYTGAKQAAPLLLEGLSKLEYRGYDSAGVATRDGDAPVQLVKAKGRLKVLSEKINGGLALPGGCGTMEELLEFLKERFSRLKGLSIRFFVEYYMNSYKAPAILGLDVLPYFLFAVATALLGSFIINQPSIMEIARQTKSTNYFYAELSRIV